MCMKKTASALSCMLSATAGLWAVATESSSDEFSASVSFETWIQPAKGEAGRIFDKLTAGKRDGFLIDCWPNQSLRVIDQLEVRYDRPGLNLTDQVREGVLKHTVYDSSKVFCDVDMDGINLKVACHLEGQAVAAADEIAQQLIRQSPTPLEEQEQQQHRQFVNRRLETLQAQMEEAEQQMQELEQQLALENSARGIADIQNQIATLEEKISTWESNYADLLSFYEGSRTNYLSVVEPATVPTASETSA